MSSESPSAASNPSHHSQESAAAPQLPMPPRAITPRARRRSWGELPVRPWMVLTLVSCLVVAYFLVTRVQEAVADRWLVNHGVDVVATFSKVNSDPVAKRWSRNDAMPATITFDWKDKPVRIDIPRLEPKAGAYAMIGEKLTIKIDPNDPQKWTEETTLKPWTHELAAVGMLLPLAAIALGMMLVKRRGVLQTWVHGSLVPATVVEVRQSGAAPRSRVIRFSLDDEADRRIWALLMPVSAGIPAPGESIWILATPQNPSRSLAARLYQD